MDTNEESYVAAMWETLQTDSVDNMDSDAKEEYFRLIDDDCHKEMREWQVDRQVELLQLRHESDQGVLSYSLNSNRFNFIEMIFKLLRNPERLDLLTGALASDKKCNFLHSLADKLPALSKRHGAVSGMIISPISTAKAVCIFKLTFELAANSPAQLYELLTNENDRGTSIIARLVESNDASVPELVTAQLKLLKEEQRFDLLKQRVFYYEPRLQPISSKGDHKCNLLMFALKHNNGEVAAYIATILGISGDRNFVTEVVLGRTEAKTDAPMPSNSLLIAAENGMWKVFETLLTALPETEQWKALFETNQLGSCAFQELVYTPGRLTEMLKLPDVRKRLQETLRDDNYCQYRFAELEMPLSSVEALSGLLLFHGRYHIPKLSQKSQPAALVLYYPGVDADGDVLDEVKPKAIALRDAFSDLGWTKLKCIDLQKEKSRILVELKCFIKDVKATCSLFMFCIASHGCVGKIQGFKGEQVCINDVLRQMKKLKGFIPKVLLLDRCRSPAEAALCQNERLRANNILILEATLPGEYAYDEFDYLKCLADEIKKGNETIQVMSSRAKTQAMQTARRQTRRDRSGSPAIPQTPHGETTAKEIFLRKRHHECPVCQTEITGYDHEHHTLCYKCTRPCCLHCAGLDKDDFPTLNKPGVKWICITCRKPWRRELFQ